MEKVIDQFYEAIKANNVDLLGSLVTDDVTLHWQGSTDIPWAGTWRGVAEIISFFETLNQYVEVVSIEPLAKLSSQENFMVFLRGEWLVGQRKQAVSAIAANRFTFKNELIQSFTVINDTEAFAKGLLD
ncbi:MAG: nuclear transport factor 2 family protein [Chloroflexota bacterium]